MKINLRVDIISGFFLCLLRFALCFYYYIPLNLYHIMRHFMLCLNDFHKNKHPA